MKTVVIVVALLLLAGLGVQFYQSQQLQSELRVLQQSVDTLQKQNLALEGQLAELAQQVGRMEQESVRGVIEQTNRALLDGWGSVLESIGREIDRAAESLQRESQPPTPTDANPPN